MKIVCDEKVPFIQGVFEPYADVIYLPGEKINAKAIRDADALVVRTRTICNKKLLSKSSVRCIATATIGFDHLDVRYLESEHIHWANAPGCNAKAVEQYIACALVHLAEKHQFNLRGKTLGVIGVGHVGNQVLEMARALDMDVLLNDPPRNIIESARDFIKLDELLSKADIVSIHVPLMMEGAFKTHHIANDEFFSKMKPGAFFINTSRGEVCDSASLTKALLSGKISGAVLDVWENEPKIDQQLLKIVDLGTMHIAGYSLEGKANGTTMAVRFVAEHLNLGALEDFAVDHLPNPEHPLINLPRELSESNRINYAIKSCYNIEQDSKNLKLNPSDFEKFRNDYSLRREFSAYDATGGGEAMHMVLGRLGFSKNRK